MSLDRETLERQIYMYTKLDEMEVVQALLKVYHRYYGEPYQTKPKLTLVKETT